MECGVGAENARSALNSIFRRVEVSEKFDIELVFAFIRYAVVVTRKRSAQGYCWCENCEETVRLVGRAEYYSGTSIFKIMFLLCDMK